MNQVMTVLKDEGKIAAVKKHRELYGMTLSETIMIINELNYELVTQA